MIEIGLGVPIDASGAERGAATFNRAVDGMGKSADSALGRIRSTMRGVEGSVFSLRNAVAGLLFGAMARDILQANIAFQRIINTLTAAKGSAALAYIEFDSLRDTVNRLALDLPSTAQQFAQMTAAAKGTSMEGDGVRRVFEGIATASSALGLSAQHTELSLYAVQQMISKGVVSMEELRRQLGDNLPGAFQLAAEASGKSTGEFIKMIKAGKVISADFLPKFAELLEKRYAKAAEIAANQTQGLINKIKTAAFEFSVFIAKSGFGPALDNALRRLTKLLNSDDLREAARTVGQVLGGAVNLAASAFEIMARHSQAVLIAIGAYAGLKTILFFDGLADSVKRLTGRLLELQAVQATLGFLSPAAQGAASVGTNLAPYQTKAGKLLSTSQFAMRSKSSSFAGSAEEFAALQFLHDKSGNVLNQTALNTRLVGSAYKGLNTEVKTLISSLGLQLGLQAAVSRTWTQAAKDMVTGSYNATRGFLAMGAAMPVNAARSLGSSLGSIGQTSISLIATLPGWLKVIGVIVGIAAVLYSLRDVQVETGIGQVRLGSIYRESWNLIASYAKDGYNAIKSKTAEAYEYVKFGFRNLADLLKGPFDEVVSYLEGTWLEKFGKAVKDAATTAADYWRDKLNLLPQYAKNVDDMDAIVRASIKPPNPAKDILDAQFASYKKKKNVDPNVSGDDKEANFQNKVAKTIGLLGQESFALTNAISINRQYNTTEGEAALALAKSNAIREANDQIMQLNVSSKHKLTEIQELEITSLHKLIAEQRVYAEAQSKYRTEFQGADIGLQQQKDMNIAVLIGERAVRALTAAQTADNVVRQFRGLMTQQEIDTLREKIRLLEIERQKQALLSEAKTLNETYDASTKYATALAHLNDLQETGVLTSKAYTLALRDLKQAADEQTDSLLLKSTSAKDGIIVAMREIERKSRQTAQNMHDAFSTAFGTLQTEIVNVLDTGKFKFSTFLDSIRHELNKILVEKVFGNFFRGILGANGNTDTPAQQQSTGGLLGLIFGRGAAATTTPPYAPGNGLQNQAVLGQALGNVTGGFQKAAANTETSFKDMVKNVGHGFTSLFSQLAGLFSRGGGGGGGIFGILSQFIGIGLSAGLGGAFKGGAINVKSPAMPNGTGQFGDFVGGMGSFGMANGGVMTSRGPIPLRKYSMGGIAYSPQLALYGETRRPEAYVPLPDGRSIPVHLQQKSNNDTHDTRQRVVIMPTVIHAKDVDSFRYSKTQIAADLATGVQMASRRK